MPSVRALAPGMVMHVRTPAYAIGTWRNLSLQRVSGGVDLPFLTRSYEAYETALHYDPAGYGVITIVEASATLPPTEVRDQAVRLRAATHSSLRAHAVLIRGEGFFVSAMRAVITGICTLAKSRAPLLMASSEQEAVRFVVDRACPIGTPTEELLDHLEHLRR